MRTVLLTFTLAAIAAAQVAPIPNTTVFKDTRTAVNTALGNAASITGSYSNPSWITALAYAKITGVPSFALLAAPVFTGQPTIPDFTLAGHTHLNAAGGGTLGAAAIASGVLAIARLATGTPTGTKFVRDDGTLAVPAGSGIITLATGSSDPTAGSNPCSGPSISNLALYHQTTAKDIWACVADNVWKKMLSTLNLGPYTLSGVVGTYSTGVAASRPSCSASSYYLASDTKALTACDGTNWSGALNPAGSVGCIFNSTANLLQCYDSAGVLTAGGNAATATALAATPSLCTTGQAPTGVLANGNATGCASISGGGGGSFLYAVATEVATSFTAPATQTAAAFTVNSAGSSSSLHSTSSAQTHFVAPTAGLYLATCTLNWASSGTGAWSTAIRRNGTEYIAQNLLTTTSGQIPAQNVSVMWEMGAGDYVECMGSPPATMGVNNPASTVYSTMAWRQMF